MEIFSGGIVCALCGDVVLHRLEEFVLVYIVQAFFFFLVLFIFKVSRMLGWVCLFSVAGFFTIVF